MGRMSKGALIAEECRRLFDHKCMELSKEDYKEAVEQLASILEGYEDCLRDEEEQEWT